MRFFFVLIISVYLCRYVGDALTGYDCGDPSSPIVAISTFSVDNCDHVESALNVSSMYIQVLSIKRHLIVEYVECSVVRHSLVYKCGAFSHSILVPGSLTIDEPVIVSSEECHDMYKSGVYKTRGGTTITGIQTGRRTSHSATDIGFVDAEGECEGTTIIHNGQTTRKAVIVSNYKILVSQKKGLEDIHYEDDGWTRNSM